MLYASALLVTFVNYMAQGWNHSMAGLVQIIVAVLSYVRDPFTIGRSCHGSETTAESFQARLLSVLTRLVVQGHCVPRTRVEAEMLIEITTIWYIRGYH